MSDEKAGSGPRRWECLTHFGTIGLRCAAPPLGDPLQKEHGLLDILIRGGTVVSQQTTERFDVGIRNGRIVASLPRTRSI